MNRALYLIIAVMLAIVSGLSGCGGGAGDASSPGGSGGGIPVLIVLVPNQYIVRTGGIILLQAKVLDGNGHPIAGKTVSYSSKTGIGVLSAPSAVTDEKGVAIVTLTSSATGYAVIEASTSSSFVMDRKTVYFNSETASPNVLVLDVDGDGDGTYNERTDFEVFEHDSILLRATLRTNTGSAVAGSAVTFYADFPYEVNFYDISGNPTTTVYTNSSGVAFINMKADLVLQEERTYLNVSAYDVSGGAVDMITLFLSPVVISQIVFTEIPDYIDLDDAQNAGNPVNITVQVYSSDGFVPDGTIVKFVADVAGTDIDSPTVFYVSTIDGQATLTMPTSLFDGIYELAPGTLMITASCGGISATDDIVLVRSATITITPTTWDLGCPVTMIMPVGYVVSGGVAPYTVEFTLPEKVSDTSPVQPGDTVGTAGTNYVTFTVEYECVASETSTSSINVFDSIGASASSIVNIN
jgi:hypothetical protein